MIIKGIHILGIIFWIGGLLVVTKLLKERLNFDKEKYQDLLKKIYFSFLIPGFLIALITGIYQLISANMVFFKQGWFHGKLTLLIILIFATIKLLIEIKKPESSKKVAGILHGIVALCALLIPIFSYVKF